MTENSNAIVLTDITDVQAFRATIGDDSSRTFIGLRKISNGDLFAFPTEWIQAVVHAFTSQIDEFGTDVQNAPSTRIIQ